jgi:hypothetical protein
MVTLYSIRPVNAVHGGLEEMDRRSIHGRRGISTSLLGYYVVVVMDFNH